MKVGLALVLLVMWVWGVAEVEPLMAVQVVVVCLLWVTGAMERAVLGSSVWQT